MLFKPFGFDREKDKTPDPDKVPDKVSAKDFWAMVIAFAWAVLPAVLLIWGVLALIIFLIF